MSDTLFNGRRFRLLNIVDDYNREVLHIETNTSLPTVRLIRSLEYLKEFRGLPKTIRVDNGPGFISVKLDQWCKEQDIQLQAGLSNAYVFNTLDEVRIKAEQWRIDYNCSRPHQSLGFVPPAEYFNPFP